MPRVTRSEWQNQNLSIWSTMNSLVQATKNLYSSVQYLTEALKETAELTSRLAEMGSLDEARIAMLESDVKKIKRSMP